jgi:hypothetical protein
MSDAKIQINFDAPAVLRKWPSIRDERVSIEHGGSPYLIAEGSLDHLHPAVYGEACHPASLV